jgi:hypothetical protein
VITSYLEIILNKVMLELEWQLPPQVKLPVRHYDFCSQSLL